MESKTDSLTPETSEPSATAPVRVQPVVGHPCHDCGKVGKWPLLMNRCVTGDFQRLCPDCLEENDPDGVMVSPCPHCRGSGREWEGWDCEYCDGTGTDDF